MGDRYMSILKIALLQIAPDKTLEENMETGVEDKEY